MVLKLSYSFCLFHHLHTWWIVCRILCSTSMVDTELSSTLSLSYEFTDRALDTRQLPANRLPLFLWVLINYVFLELHSWEKWWSFYSLRWWGFSQYCIQTTSMSQDHIERGPLYVVLDEPSRFSHDRLLYSLYVPAEIVFLVFSFFVFVIVCFDTECLCWER